MKILGAVIVFIAASVLGFGKCQEAKRQEQLTAAVISMLETVKSEIITRRSPLRALFKILQKNTAQADLSVFIEDILKNMDRLGETSFMDIWSECAERDLALLPASIRSAVCDLGMSLGRYDAKMQEASIDRCISLAVREYEELRSKLLINKKMYIGLYSGAGAIIAIVFL